ncbi:hypothetical protein GGR57DRAFT_199487 [Xylariaceae sp. FL1272]|nr:hypothetical protein GGR57DRAFT_199487 [Xylariaceae sp. FL1272]
MAYSLRKGSCHTAWCQTTPTLNTRTKGLRAMRRCATTLVKLHFSRPTTRNESRLSWVRNQALLVTLQQVLAAIIGARKALRSDTVHLLWCQPYWFVYIRNIPGSRLHILRNVKQALVTNTFTWAQVSTKRTELKHRTRNHILYLSAYGMLLRRF